MIAKQQDYLESARYSIQVELNVQIESVVGQNHNLQISVLIRQYCFIQTEICTHRWSDKE